MVVVERLLWNTLLFDLYAEMLTERQREIYHAYFFEDMTMEEVGDKLGITRQAVNFALKQAGRNLDHLEGRLGLVAIHQRAKGHIAALRAALEAEKHDEASRILIELTELI